MDSPLRHHLVVLALLLLLTDFDVCNGGLRLSSSEKAMVGIFEAWIGSNPNLSAVLNWSLHNDPCADWSGCVCGYYNRSTDQWADSGGQDVAVILLHGNSNPSEQSNTSRNNFALVGELPAAFEKLTTLAYLNLEGNDLQGTLDVLANIPSTLYHLDLSSNHFTGGVRFNISNLTLDYLDLGGNNLEGTLEFIADIPSTLYHLDLSSNHFTGGVRFNNSNLTLEYLNLGGNNLEGTLDFIADIPSTLYHLDLSNNQFTGGVRFNSSNATLKHLYLANNKLDGTLDFIANIASTLLDLDLSNNQFTGRVHFNNSNTSLEFVDFSNNQFTGVRFIPFFPHLQYLDFGNNHLEGALDFIANLPSTLYTLDLSNNQFTGGVRFNNSNMNLQYLDLGGNILGGTLDFTFDIPSTLYHLDLSNNQFIGGVRFNNANTNLQYLDLSNNQLNGSIDFILGLQSSLETIFLTNNSFSGGFPMLSSSKLKTLDVSNNNLSGVIDFHMFKDATTFLYINVSDNHFNNMITTDYVLNFTTIDLSNNDFKNFTISLDILPQLTSLYLDYNLLTSLTLPNTNFSGFTLSTLSLVGNKISKVSYSKSGPFAEALIGSQNILFLGGNPYCNNIDSNVKSSVCRFNESSPLLPVTKTFPRLEIVFSTIGAAFFLVMLAFGLVTRKLYKKNLAYRELEQELAKQDVKPTIYSYNELRIATRDFDLENKLGEGGFGVVYKGIFPDNTTIAVKRLIKSRLVLSDFFNEIAIISCVRHRNLIKLKGCCLSGDQRILVYEYVENKNLAQALWDSPNENNLEMNWSSRLNIILGIARGLSYLHEEVQPPIIHRDIKAPNILLDKDLNPKIADFGLALLFPDLDEGKSHYTGTITGTRGYMSPEYANFGHISTAIDVFSFGIIILEIISGRKNIDIGKPPEQQILLQWAWKMYKSNELWHLVDPKLETEIGTEEIIRVIKIGLLCLQQTPANRPKVSTVIVMLLDGTQVETNCLEVGSEYGSVDSYHATTTTSRLCVVRGEEEEEKEEEESSFLATSA